MGKELKSQSLAVVEEMTLVQKLGHKFEVDKTVDLNTTLRKPCSGQRKRYHQNK